MGIDIYQNYSQFYKGTESIKNYGSNANKKDKLVRYEFNTTDEHGNKVMDKMSREETLQAMKDIRSQYGDDAIVEFSGDGMAALVESKKSGNGFDLDKIMAKTPEQQVVPDDMITQLEGTYRRVSANDEINTHVSWHDTLKEKAPDVCDELDDLMQRILDHALNHSGDGEKFGAKFVELVKKAETAISVYDTKKGSVGDIQNDTGHSDKTANYLQAYSGLHGADKAIAIAVANCSKEQKGYIYDIIRQNFLIGNIGSMTEKERQENISLGMNKAEYAAKNYISEDNRKSFLEAMESIAKLAETGKADSKGNMDYGVKKEPFDE